MAARRHLSSRTLAKLELGLWLAAGLLVAWHAFGGFDAAPSLEVFASREHPPTDM